MQLVTGSPSAFTVPKSNVSSWKSKSGAPGLRRLELFSNQCPSSPLPVDPQHRVEAGAGSRRAAEIALFVRMV